MIEIRLLFPFFFKFILHLGLMKLKPKGQYSQVDLDEGYNGKHSSIPQ